MFNGSDRNYSLMMFKSNILFLMQMLKKIWRTAKIQINNIEVDVSLHDERLDSVDDNVDEWDDKIRLLEVANVDITDRLITVEEILLGERVR